MIVMDPLVMPSLSRRTFLARCGAIGAGAVFAGGPLAAMARAATPAEQLIAAGGPFMRQLAFDTISGVAVLVVPGPDAYSKAQGQTSKTAGAIEAKANELVLGALDDFLPLPDSYSQTLASAFTSSVSESPLPPSVVAALGPAFQQGSATIDSVLKAFLASDGATPLSLLVSLALNAEASNVNPNAPSGPFPASPFANLSAADKAKVFERFETGDTDLIAMLDAAGPGPLKGELSGTFKFVAGTLLEFFAFTPYCEYGVFDRKTRKVTKRPVGWDTSRFMLGRSVPADGWHEFLGYYKGHARSLGPAPLYAPPKTKAKKKKKPKKKKAATAGGGGSNA